MFQRRMRYIAWMTAGIQKNSSSTMLMSTLLVPANEQLPFTDKGRAAVLARK